MEGDFSRMISECRHIKQLEWVIETGILPRANTTENEIGGNHICWIN